MAKQRGQRFSPTTQSMGTPEIAQAELLAIEDEWMNSRLRGDAKYSDDLLDDEYKGTTSDGAPQSKLDFVQAIAFFARANTAGGHIHRHIRVYGELAVSTGLATVHSANRDHSYRYLRVFRRTDNRWRLVASQSTRLCEQ